MQNDEELFVKGSLVSVLKNRSAVSNHRLREILRGFLPCVSMVKAADARKPHNFCVRRRTCLSCSALWRIFDRSVNPVRVVVANVVPEKPTQMALIDHDHMVNEFAFA